MKVGLGKAHISNASDTTDVPGHGHLEDNLESDFSKDNKTATFAPGFPKPWGKEEWKFTSGSSGISSISATSDEKFLAIATEDTIVIFEIDRYKLASVLKTGSKMVHKVEFAKDSRIEEGYTFACEHGPNYSEDSRHITIWHLDSDCKEDLGSESTSKLVVKGYLPSFSPTAFSHDSKTLLHLAKTHDERGNHLAVVAVDTETGNQKFKMKGHTGPIMWTGFSPDDKLIATTAWDGYLKLYDSHDGSFLREFGPSMGQNWTCAFSANGKDIAVTRGGPPSAFIWRTEDSKSFPTALPGTKGWPRCISYSLDGERLAIGAADGRLAVYKTKALTLEHVWQLAAEKDVFRWLLEVTELKWLEGGKKLCWRPSDGSVQMYDFEENLKWKWGPDKDDRWSLGSWFNTVAILERKGLMCTRDQDKAVRIWKLPI